MTMKDIHQISVFENYMNPVPDGNIHIRAFVNDVLNGTFKNEVEKIRAAKDKNKLKSKLPAVTISGTFTKRANDCLIRHSGFICIDIDTKPEGAKWEALRDTAGSWDNVYFSALSVSGNGLFLIIPILKPEKHRQHFEALRIEFDKMGISIDKACKDVARLRGVSYDPAAIFNPNAKPYRNIYQPKHTRKTGYVNRGVNADKLTGWVESKGIYFEKGQRHPYITQLAGAYHRLGISQSEAESKLIQYAQSDFTREEIIKIIDHMYSKISWRNETTAAVN